MIKNSIIALVFIIMIIIMIIVFVNAIITIDVNTIDVAIVFIGPKQKIDHHTQKKARIQYRFSKI